MINLTASTSLMFSMIIFLYRLVQVWVCARLFVGKEYERGSTDKCFQGCDAKDLHLERNKIWRQFYYNNQLPFCKN